MAVGLKYIDEEDKCFGITGMAVSMVIWDAESLLSSISLDSPAEESVAFTHEFYFAGNPRVSAKAAWTQILEHYQLSIGMLIANVMCRNCVLHHSNITGEMKNLLYKHVEEEGINTCSLEKDEVRKMFDKSYEYLYRIFSHHGVQGIVRDFAADLRSRRELTQAEVIEKLRALSML